MFKVFLVIFLVLIEESYQFTDSFSEELYLKPLESGHINSYFQFTTKWDMNKNDSRK